MPKLIKTLYKRIGYTSVPNRYNSNNEVPDRPQSEYFTLDVSSLDSNAILM